MRGADKMREGNVISQAFADAISGRIKWGLSRLDFLLGDNRAGKRNQQGDQLREFR